MTPRELVRTAFSHQEPERVPVDFGSHRSSGIAAIAYARLKKALGISSGDIYVHDMIQQLAIVEPDVLDALGVDVIELGRGFLVDPGEWRDWQLPDGTQCKIPPSINLEHRDGDWYLLSDDGVDLGVQRKGMLYFEQVHWPWLEMDPSEQDFGDLAEALAHSMWTNARGPGAHLPLSGDGLVELSDGARRLRESTDRAITGLFGGNLFEIPQFLYRIDNYLMHMATYPEGCQRLAQALVDYHTPRLEAWIRAVGPHVDSILFGDDLGGQNGPLVSPQMYRDLIKPWHAKLWNRAKELAPHALIQLHSCGSIEPLMNDLIDAGLEASNPVQITSQGMDPTHLKLTYGDRFVFWGGGCNTRDTLPLGSPDDVRRNVHELLDVWAPGGGYVFQQVHNILADVPPENVIAMFDAVKSWRPGSAEASD